MHRHSRSAPASTMRAVSSRRTCTSSANTGPYGDARVHRAVGHRTARTLGSTTARPSATPATSPTPTGRSPAPSGATARRRRIFALECHMDDIARASGSTRSSSAGRTGSHRRPARHRAARSASGAPPRDRARGPAAVDELRHRRVRRAGPARDRLGAPRRPEWRQPPDRPSIRRGIGFALCMQAPASRIVDMGGASIKMNDDGSFNLLVGATDLGTGADTVLAQIAAEVLGVARDDIVVVRRRHRPDAVRRRCVRRQHDVHLGHGGR